MEKKSWIGFKKTDDSRAKHYFIRSYFLMFYQNKWCIRLLILAPQGHMELLILKTIFEWKNKLYKYNFYFAICNYMHTNKYQFSVNFTPYIRTKVQIYIIHGTTRKTSEIYNRFYPKFLHTQNYPSWQYVLINSGLLTLRIKQIFSEI